MENFKNNKNLKNYLVFFGFLFVILIFTFWILNYQSNDGENRTADLKALAQCLADNNATMYGAYWCSHCQNQKTLLGDSFELVNYVECTEETQLCLDKKIEGYPTWIFGDGHRLAGELSLKELAQESGCQFVR